MITLIEFATFILVMAFLVTQIVIPWTESRPYFPAFRRRERRLARLEQLELERQREEAALEELSKPLEHRQKEIN